MHLLVNNHIPLNGWIYGDEFPDRNSCIILCTIKVKPHVTNGYIFKMIVGARASLALLWVIFWAIVFWATIEAAPTVQYIMILL